MVTLATLEYDKFTAVVVGGAGLPGQGTGGWPAGQDTKFTGAVDRSVGLYSAACALGWLSVPRALRGLPLPRPMGTDGLFA